MKKKLLIATAMTAAIVLTSIVPAMALPYVTLNSLDSDITIGETFEVQVLAHDDSGIDFEELLSFGFDVDSPLSSNFDSPLSFISYAGYTVESGFEDDSSFFPVDVAGSVFPGSPNDDILLATLTFTAGPTTGTDTLTIFGDSTEFFGLGYLDQGFIDIDASLDITVGAAPVPEPSTMFLLGTGLVSLAGFARKQSRH